MVFAYILPAADLVFVMVLALVLYLPRHHRKDLVSAYIAVNVGVLAVSMALSEASVNAGLGLGLFGVLAIIRLRSEELQQHEVAYYFSALSLGVIGGLGAELGWWSVALMAAVVSAIGIVDAPGVLRRHRSGQVVLDQAIADEAILTARLEQLLKGRVLEVRTVRLDLVNDTTIVDVRYRLENETPHGS
ncbi:MAG: DUF4956 domain-containing protein [Propionibacteriaceae bacterium]|jgi:hypothetical protein|nr:DUF4956 domain-containing protein [Propionibacteriaceae bacterium]